MLDNNILKMKPFCDLHLLIFKNISEKKWFEAYFLIEELEKSIGNMKEMIKKELDKEYIKI
jgi:hypothetical protein